MKISIQVYMPTFLEGSKRDIIFRFKLEVNI